MKEPESLLGGAFTNRPHPVLEQLREGCPVTSVAGPRNRHAWVVTRADDVRTALLDPRLSRQPKDVDPHAALRRAMDLTLVDYDPPEHTRIRKIVTPLLTPRRLARYRPQVEAATRELLAAIPRSGPVDLMASFAGLLPFRIICELFGIAETGHGELNRRMAALVDRSGRPRTAVEETLDWFDGFVAAEIDRRQGDPGDDLLSAITAASAAAGDVSRSELISLCATMMISAVDGAAQMIGICLVALLTEPAFAARVRADPALAPRAVEEVLRWDTSSPFATMRRATEDFELAGTVISEGDGVLVALAAANRDPRRYDSPDRLDLDRPNSDHFGFGFGHHYCLGASLARLELEVFVAEFVKSCPGAVLAIPAAELTWRGSFLHRRLENLPVSLTG
jgi:cytochrome P450